MIAKHAIISGEGSTHTSGVLFVSTCNCGKTQGRRDDPYTIKKANFEFYELMRTNCTSCEKSESVEFPVFVPSSAEFKAAEITVQKSLGGLILSEVSGKTPDEKISELQLTQASASSLSIGSSDDENSEKEDKHEDDSGDEIVVKIGATDLKEEQPSVALVSTTEYLDSMPLLTVRVTTIN